MHLRLDGGLVIALAVGDIKITNMREGHRIAYQFTPLGEWTPFATLVPSETYILPIGYERVGSLTLANGQGRAVYYQYSSEKARRQNAHARQ